MRKLLCKHEDRVATEDKNNIAYEIDCIYCEAVYFGQSERSLKLHFDEHKGTVGNCDCDKNEIAEHFWVTTLAEIRRKLLIGKTG